MLIIPGITEADKKDLAHWMTYREKRPASPCPEDILQKLTSTAETKDRFSECKVFLYLHKTFYHDKLIHFMLIGLVVP